MTRIILLIWICLLMGSTKLLAQEEVDSLFEVLENSKEQDKANIYLQIAKANWRTSTDSIYKYSRIALDLGHKFNDQQVIGKAYSYIGVSWFYRAEYDSAEKYYILALDFFKKANDDNGKGIVLNNMGVLQKRNANYSDALNYYNEALRLHSRMHDTLQIGGALLNIGIVYFTINDYDKALSFYLQALEQFEAIHDQVKIAGALTNIGEVYAELYEPYEAIKYFNQALELQMKVNDIYGMANIYSNIGIIQNTLQDYNMALEYFKKSRELYLEMDDKDALAFVSGHIAEVYQLMGRNKEAMEEFQKSINLNKVIGDNEGTGYAMLGMTNLLLGMKKLPLASEYRDSVLIWANLSQSKDLKAKSYLISARVDSALNKPWSALAAMQIYSSLQDSIFGSEMVKKIADMRTRYETDKIERDNAFLRKEQEYLSDKRKKERVIFSVIVAGVLILAVFIVIIYRSFKNRKLQQALFRAVMEAENTERKKMAEEIHDGLGPLLATTKIYISEIDAGKGEDNMTYHANALELINQAIDTTRSVSHSLMPSEILNYHLDEALHRFTDKLNGTGKILIHLNITGQINFTDIQNEIIYRVVTELINNTMKHSGATDIKTEMWIDRGALKISYYDNGKGFDVTTATSESTGIGLKNISNRIQSLNGMVEYTSKTGEGLKVDIIIPLV